MVVSEKAQEIVAQIYQRYATPEKNLFGIEPRWRNVILVIVDLTIQALVAEIKADLAKKKEAKENG